MRAFRLTEVENGWLLMEDSDVPGFREALASRIWTVRDLDEVPGMIRGAEQASAQMRAAGQIGVDLGAPYERSVPDRCEHHRTASVLGAER